jgi:hypothetical protein
MGEPSGNSTVQYFEGNTYVGDREVYCCGYARSSGDRFSAFWPHTAYFCPICGELWGRAIYQYHFTYSPIPTDSWVVEVRRCVKHGDGTFLNSQLLDHCSTRLLTRELLAILENWKPSYDD